MPPHRSTQHLFVAEIHNLTWISFDLFFRHDIKMTTAEERYVDDLDFGEKSWKRPEGPQRVWRVVDGRRKMTDGEIPKFSIQELPKELENDAIDFMVEYFCREEPLSVDTGLRNDPLTLREFCTLWKQTVSQGISVVALKVNPDPSMKPVIAGVNILGIVQGKDEENSGGAIQFKSDIMKKLWEIISKLTHEAAILEKYGIDKYMFALGLCVHPSFRGQGLGEEILRVRNDIGLAYQIPATETTFTATASQILASRVGFEVLHERKYSELLDGEGKVAFPGVTVEFIKVMGKKLY